MPPPQVEPVSILTDCAVCHVPERAPSSLYKLLSGGRLILDIEYEPSVPNDERGPWRERLLERLADSPVEALRTPGPNAAPVHVRVGVEVDWARTSGGTKFRVAVAKAEVRLHRAHVEVTSNIGAASDEVGAVRKALADLTERVYLVLTW